MSLWKLRVGAEAYYLSQVASGLDDYYSGQGESVGRWVGNASAGLGLSGEVTGEDLRAVLAGLAPGSGLTPNGEQLRAHPRRVPGFDLTFSVPKSVSVVYALGDPLVQGAVIEAGEAAVAEAIAWLEREACHVRRGTNRRDAKVTDVQVWGTRRLPGAGFVAAQFRHRTSRAGDPQLHWHVLVANITRGPDGRWTALDGSGLYRSQRAAGVVFQAALRRGLTKRLGVEWTAPVNDAREIAGVPQRILRLFSKRRDEIETELDRLGASGPKAAEAAALATRKAKGMIDTEGIVERWHAEAIDAGWGVSELDTLLGQPALGRSLQEPDAEELVAAVGDRLIGSDSTFTRHDVTQVIAAQLPAGAGAGDVDRLTAGVLAHPEIVAIATAADPDRPSGWEERYTTRRLIGLETELSDALACAVASGRGTLASDTVAAACSGASLGPDQHAAVTRLCTQGNAIEVLIGRAGTGKTYTLAAVAAAYRATAWQVVGVAPSARAARELETGAGIASFTIPRFDHHLQANPLTATTVVIVDEAGMCGTVDLHHVVTAARTAGAKVIVVGDPYQLPEVQAGGGLAAGIAVLGDQVAELTVNRRQGETWEIEALDHLRHGDVRHAWDTYLAHDRVRILDDPTDVHNHAVNDWWAAHTAGGDALLLAGTRSEAGVLNRLARQRAASEHLLHGPALTVAGRTFQSGDRVLIGRNNTTHTTPDGVPVRIDNGTLGTISAVHPDTISVDVELRTGQSVRLGRGYLEDGHLDHGYAMTIHKSQGVTCDQVFVVGPSGLYREAAYVALSRARHGAHLYATRRQATEIGERDHTTGLPLPGTTDTDDFVLTALSRSQAKTFATFLDPDVQRVADLARLPLDTLTTGYHRAASAEARAKASGLCDPADRTAALERARYARRHLAAGRRVRALDRDNVGTTVTVHDTIGTATVQFIADNGTAAIRTLAWSQLKPIDHPDPVDLTPDAQRWLYGEAAITDRARLQWEEALAACDVQPGDAAALKRAIEDRRQRVARQLPAEGSDWLPWWIGHRPADPAGAAVWDDTITTIAAWRDRHHTPPDQPGLGPQPSNPPHRDAWLDTMTVLLEQRRWLAARNPRPDLTVMPTLTALEIRDRIVELDARFADAPVDRGRVIDDLLAGKVTDSDVALGEARTAQTERDRWILANWPYIVEHHELQRLVDRHGPLAHWSTAIRPSVGAALDQLAALLDHNPPVEPRTLARLHTALAALDPAKRLRELTEQLVALNDHTATVARERSLATTPQRHALLSAELDTLTSSQHALRAAVAAERQAVKRPPYGPAERNALNAAITNRTATIYAQAIHQRPEWLIEMLNQLDDQGTLVQLRPAALQHLVAEAAATRDLGASVPTDIGQRGAPPRPLVGVGARAMADPLRR